MGVSLGADDKVILNSALVTREDKSIHQIYLLIHLFLLLSADVRVRSYNYQPGPFLHYAFH